MAYLFEVNERIVFPNAETLLISPFKEIWERDESNTKETALKELTYIEFMSSMKKSNPYRQYPNDKKHEVLKQDIIQDVQWIPDSLIYEAITKIQLFQQEASITYSYYMAAKRAAEKMKSFFMNFDITERNEKTGNPIYKPRDITSSLNDTGRVLTELKNLEKKVEEELYEDSKMRSDKQISPFADRNSMK